MNDLGRLEDLPADYVQALRDVNLVPLWPSLRGVLPPKIPTRQTIATCWAYKDIRPVLLKAGELTPIEKAERRVLVLANPGHDLEKMQASAAIYLGMQLLLPGEWAPSHRHTPNAVRMIVEGEGAYTTVEGEKCPMSRGDLILTPSGLWHEHGHDGTDPVIWLDVLDLPLMFYMEASYHINGDKQEVKAGRGDLQNQRAGLAPTQIFERSRRAYPLYRYPWADTKNALHSMSSDNPSLDCVQITYINPDTGMDAENVLGFYALMLRPNQTLRLPARSPAQVFHVVEGQASITIETQVPTTFLMVEADTCAAPGYEAVTLKNTNKDQPTFIFIADESPLHRKLGVYENRG
jgi:gentisate 1,2-dioxygenase